jgi:RNA polymerase sigma-70 factor (family 1)
VIGGKMAHVNYSTLSDSEIFSLMKNSDHFAYTEIYQRYFQLIFRHAINKLRDEQIAKDIVQDVFTNLWIKRTSNVVESNLPGYLYKAVRNRIFNFWAHESVVSNYWKSFPDNNNIDEYADVAADYRIREQQLADYIERQIQDLPAKMRMVFDLSRKEYLSHREIAERLNTSEGNVSKQVGNALKILRAKLSSIMYLFMLALLCIIIMVGSYFRFSFFGLIHALYNF